MHGRATTGGSTGKWRWRSGSSLKPMLGQGLGARQGTRHMVDANDAPMAMAMVARGCSSMVEQKPSKLTTRVRFPSPAPAQSALTRQTGAATWRACRAPGEVAEWLKAADCKSARASVRWFESSPLHHPASQTRSGIRRIGNFILAPQGAFRGLSAGGRSLLPTHIPASHEFANLAHGGSETELV